MQVFLGIDWSHTHHDACWLAARGQALSRLTVPQTVEGLTQLDRACQQLLISSGHFILGGVDGIMHNMTTANTTEPEHWREYRRLRVWEMHQQGHRQQTIADALGLTQAAVS